MTVERGEAGIDEVAVALGKSLLPVVKVAFVNYEDLMGVIASIEDLFLESSILCF